MTAKTFSFVVRISCAASGQVTGVVERVTTGAKERFDACDAIGPLIQQMLDAELPISRRPPEG